VTSENGNRTEFQATDSDSAILLPRGTSLPPLIFKAAHDATTSLPETSFFYCPGSTAFIWGDSIVNICVTTRSQRYKPILGKSATTGH
jgi:hypothetical protein